MTHLLNPITATSKNPCFDGFPEWFESLETSLKKIIWRIQQPNDFIFHFFTVVIYIDSLVYPQKTENFMNIYLENLF